MGRLQISSCRRRNDYGVVITLLGVMAKQTPAVRHLRYLLTHNGENSEDSHYIDLAKHLSEINRRLYEQGKVYHVAGVTVHTTSQTYVKFCVCPDTWVSRAAWNRGKKAWKEMRRQALIGAGGTRKEATWADFKVRISEAHRVESDASDIPKPVDSGDNELEEGEWIYSVYSSPDGTTTVDEYEAHLCGNHSGSAGSWTSVGLIKSFGEIRTTVNRLESPAADSDGDDDPLANLFDDGTQDDEILQNIDDHGNAPPYHMGANDADMGESYVGSSSNFPNPIVVGTTATSYVAPAGGKSLGYIGPFSALCGLVEIETLSTLPSDTIEVLFELMPGNYKGVAASTI